MRRDLVIALVGGAVIVLAALGLVTGALREGPLDGQLAPVRLDVHVEGTYLATGPSDVNGLCLQPPCEARTTIDLQFLGLPSGSYAAYLQGEDGRSHVGDLRRSGDVFTLRHDATEDHRDKEMLVVMWGSENVLRVPVVAEIPATIDSTFPGRVITPPGTYHANEIGGVSVSTVVDVWFSGEPPPERRYHAWFHGTAGWVDLGVLESDDDGSRLDARIERLRLEDQDRLVVYVEPTGSVAGSAPAGFPVLSADL